MSEIIYLNGDFIAKEQAKISVLDRGFLFGDGVYEVIPIYKGIPFRLSQHLIRLFDCLAQTQISNPYPLVKWHALIDQVISVNNGDNLSLYIQITRGIEPIRAHVISDKHTPSVMMMTSPLINSAVDIEHLTSIKAALIEDIRWQHCDIKAISLLPNILLRQQAQALGCQEAILHRSGQITEGSTSNIFTVKNGDIFTPEKNQFILGGITRDLIIELAQKAAINVYQTKIMVSDIYQADEVWISSSSREISPVRQINDKIINQGLIGPVAKQMHCAFQYFKQALKK